jgi:hypothetical protein
VPVAFHLLLLQGDKVLQEFGGTVASGNIATFDDSQEHIYIATASKSSDGKIERTQNSYRTGGNLDLKFGQPADGKILTMLHLTKADLVKMNKFGSGETAIEAPEIDRIEFYPRNLLIKPGDSVVVGTAGDYALKLSVTTAQP